MDDQKNTDKLSAIDGGIGENNLLYKNEFKYEDNIINAKYSFEDTLENRRDILRSLDGSFDGQRFPGIIKQEANNDTHIDRFQIPPNTHVLNNHALNSNLN